MTVIEMGSLRVAPAEQLVQVECGHEDRVPLRMLFAFHGPGDVAEAVRAAADELRGTAPPFLSPTPSLSEALMFVSDEILERHELRLLLVPVGSCRPDVRVALDEDADLAVMTPAA